MILKYAVVIFLYLTLCKADKIEEEIVQMIDDAEKYKEVYLFGGLSIQKIEGSVVENRSVKPHDLLSKLDYYFKTHKLNFEMPDESTLENDARGNRLKRLGLPLLLALKLKLTTLIPVLLKAVAFVTVKAFIFSFLALSFSGTLLLKELLAKKQEKVSTAYISATGPIGIEMESWNRNSDIQPDLSYGTPYYAS